ncbi:hypothetical protein D8M30_13285 [Corynebacterium pseudodiphtheriticum]|nr:hypothetical protein D8M30_13285 [Corynebacterium pseudodiphtheriticum]
MESFVEGYTSSFYPVFVNLIDNSIFWLERVHGRKREILLSSENDGWVVSDTGPGINSGDRKNIFALNFSRRPGGRGMGLYISRQSLQKVGYDLMLIDSTVGAAFKLKPKEEFVGKEID